MWKYWQLAFSLKQFIYSRDNSGDCFKVDESRSRQARSSSRVSDYSSALPDLEVETDIIINEQVEKDEPVMLKAEKPKSCKMKDCGCCQR